MTAVLTEVEPTAAQRVWQARRNDTEINAFLGYANVPKTTVKAAADGVYVTVTSPDDLAQWMYALGGEIQVGAAAGGFKTWVLHTVLRCSDRRRLPVHVAVVVPADEPLYMLDGSAA